MQRKGVYFYIAAPLKKWNMLESIPVPSCLALPSKQLVGSDGSSAEVRLVRAYFSYMDHKGGVILLESGQSRMDHRPVAQNFDARQWSWKAVLSCKWQLDGEHINALEARALLLALRWRSRSAARFSKRFLHLTDSKVALGAYCKHRSNARSFNYIVTRSSALQLASSMTPILGFVRSSLNPADLPSRQLLNLGPKNWRKGSQSGAAAP